MDNLPVPYHHKVIQSPAPAPDEQREATPPQNADPSIARIVAGCAVYGGIVASLSFFAGLYAGIESESRSPSVIFKLISVTTSGFAVFTIVVFCSAVADIVQRSRTRQA